MNVKGRAVRLDAELGLPVETYASSQPRGSHRDAPTPHPSGARRKKRTHRLAISAFASLSWWLSTACSSLHVASLRSGPGEPCWLERVGGLGGDGRVREVGESGGARAAGGASAGVTILAGSRVALRPFQSASSESAVVGLRRGRRSPRAVLPPPSIRSQDACPATDTPERFTAAKCIHPETTATPATAHHPLSPLHLSVPTTRTTTALTRPLGSPEPPGPLQFFHKNPLYYPRPLTTAPIRLQTLRTSLFPPRVQQARTAREHLHDPECPDGRSGHCVSCDRVLYPQGGLGDRDGVAVRCGRVGSGALHAVLSARRL